MNEIEWIIFPLAALRKSLVYAESFFYAEALFFLLE